MSLFAAFGFSPSKAEAELSSFRAWLDGVTFVAETEVVAQIAQRSHMVCLLGPTASIAAPNLIKWELELGGVFRTDLALGNDGRREFALIEFEGANENSLFGRKRTKQYRHWSGELDHGFGQTVDWSYYHAYNLRDATLHDNFGGPIRRSAYLVICGRDQGVIGQIERERLDFRRRHVQVQGVPSLLLTYDEMVVAMADNLEIWKT